MPQQSPTPFLNLPLEAFQLLDRFELHDVWQVELRQGETITLPELRKFFYTNCHEKPGLPVQALFALRTLAGRVFNLEAKPRKGVTLVQEALPDSLAERSLIPPGELEGPFTTLYFLPEEAMYEIVNTTVHAILVISLQQTEHGKRFYWATYLRPVGRITRLYMALIDPFRRYIVYPGLERWLQRVWVALTREIG